MDNLGVTSGFILVCVIIWAGCIASRARGFIFVEGGTFLSFFLAFCFSLDKGCHVLCRGREKLIESST